MIKGKRGGLASSPPLIDACKILYPDFAVAIAAVNRFTVAGFKRNLGSLTAIRTRCRKHLAGAIRAIVRGAGASISKSADARRFA